MSTPQARFEVPPEYAEVYERAYRRAYEQGLTLEAGADSPQPAVERAPDPGRRRAPTVPQQRSAPPQEEPSQVAAEPVLDRGPAATAEPKARRRRRHRGVPRTGSTLVPLLGLVALAVILLGGAFVLGRVTAPASKTSDASTTPRRTAPSPSGYVGPVTALVPSAVTATCTASPTTDAAGVTTTYDAANLIDGNPTTAWRCDPTSVGQTIDLTLPADSAVVEVGLVPGYAVTDSTGTDLYAQNDRVTRVQWTFDDGVSRIQEISADPADRSLRVLAVPRTVTTHVRMTVLAVDPGPTGLTPISTVALSAAG